MRLGTARFRAQPRRTCAWLVSGVSGRVRPSPRPQTRRTALLGFFALRHITERRIRFTRGFHAPAPSALRVSHPLDGLLPSIPRGGPSTATASLGFALQGLAPPDRRAPLHGASPLLSFPRPGPKARTVATPEALSEPGRGPTASPATGTETDRTLPSWDFAPPGLSPSPPWEPASRPAAPPALPAESAPYVPLPGGASGDW